jgi:hypothetical protein
MYLQKAPWATEGRLVPAKPNRQRTASGSPPNEAARKGHTGDSIHGRLLRPLGRETASLIKCEVSFMGSRRLNSYRPEATGRLTHGTHPLCWPAEYPYPAWRLQGRIRRLRRRSCGRSQFSTQTASTRTAQPHLAFEFRKRSVEINSQPVRTMGSTTSAAGSDR